MRIFVKNEVLPLLPAKAGKRTGSHGISPKIFSIKRHGLMGHHVAIGRRQQPQERRKGPLQPDDQRSIIGRFEAGNVIDLSVAKGL